MRQLFNWRFFATVAVLAVLAVLARAALADDDTLESVVEPEQIERAIDLIDPIVAATQSEDFAIQPTGLTTGFLDLALDDVRTMRIVPGTYGEIDCDGLAEPNQCVVVADLLGDAVIWFAILPRSSRTTFELPPILDLVDGEAVFESGWRIPYAPVIERDCDGEDIPTFSDFLRRFSDDSVTIVDLEERQVVAVRCGEPNER